jgi:hypothetical protein
MTNPAAEQKAIEIVDAFMDQEFEEEADAAAWLVARIAAVPQIRLSASGLDIESWHCGAANGMTEYPRLHGGVRAKE